MMGNTDDPMCQKRARLATTIGTQQQVIGSCIIRCIYNYGCAIPTCNEFIVVLHIRGLDIVCVLL